jgi:DNA mismatch repair protein MutS2
MNYDKIYPTLDLHGEYSFSAEVLTKEFINDNINLKNKKLCIIHGIGSGILKDTVHRVLKNDKRIKSFKVDFMNPGCTLVEIKEDINE